MPRSLAVRASAITRSGEMASSPPPLTILPPAHQRPPRYFSQDEIWRFFDVIEGPRDRALFTVMYLHGLRVDDTRQADAIVERMMTASRVDPETDRKILKAHPASCDDLPRQRQGVEEFQPVQPAPLGR